MSEASEMQVLGAFKDRDLLEAAVQALQNQGIERSQLTVLGTEDAMRRHVGLEVAPPTGTAGAPAVNAQEQRSVENVTPLLAGLPLYVGAVLAAGATVASGGTLAVAAAAALAGGAGGGALGFGAAKVLHGQADASYTDQLQKGGVVLLVQPRSADDLETARRILGQKAERTAEQPQEPSST